MDSFELNKIAGAVLGTCLFAMGTGVLADIIFEPHMPEKPGFMIAVTETPAAGGPAAPAAAEVPPIGVRLATADAARGAEQFKKCMTCHTIEKGGPTKQGPNLWGVVDRDIASMPGFKYSSAIAAHEGNWTYDNIDHFITNPKGFISGTAMSFAGIRDPGQRADLIAYLRTQADTPAPLPTASE